MSSCGVLVSTACVMNLHSAVSSSIRSCLAASSGSATARFRSPGTSWTLVFAWMLSGAIPRIGTVTAGTGEGVLLEPAVGIVFASGDLDTSVANRSTTSPILILLAVGELDRAVDADAVDARAVQAEVAEVPAAVLEVDLGVQPGGEFVAQDDRVVAAAAERDRAGRATGPSVCGRHSPASRVSRARIFQQAPDGPADEGGGSDRRARNRADPVDQAPQKTLARDSPSGSPNLGGYRSVEKRGRLTARHSPQGRKRAAMQTRIEGAAYVLGDNIDTDQIIPAQYLTYNPSIPAEYKMFGKFALVRRAGRPGRAAQGARPVPHARRRRVHLAVHDHDRREELRLRVEPRARADRAGRRGHRRGRRRVLRPHLLPQRGQRRLPDPAGGEDAAHRPRLHRRQAGRST